MDHKIDLEHFAYKTDLSEYFLKADMIISHGGSGSILDAIRGPLFEPFPNLRVPYLIVVPNRNLLDDHQMDLIRELAKMDVVKIAETNSLYCVFDGSLPTGKLLDTDVETAENILS